MNYTATALRPTDKQAQDFYMYREHLHAAAVVLVNRWNSHKHLFSICDKMYGPLNMDYYRRQTPLWFIEANETLRQLGDPAADMCHICAGSVNHG